MNGDRKSQVSSLKPARLETSALRLGFFLTFVCVVVPASAQTTSDRAQALLQRGTVEFRDGRITESVAAFDELAKLVPDQAPELWQRGIALYYAGRYQDCRAQFESHRTVNPNDVENAAWHFLCVAKAESPTKAKAALLPVGPDSRVPMGQIYRMFGGTLTPEAVLTAAGTSPASQFYAHLYTGLYFDALGNKDRALEHITAAAKAPYASVAGFMGWVARIHLSTLQSK